MGHGERITELLALVHTNICGPFDVQTRDGYLYFIIFIDDYSQYGYMYLIKYNSKVFKMFKKFKWKVDKQTEKPLKVFRSDQGEK